MGAAGAAVAGALVSAAATEAMRDDPMVPSGPSRVTRQIRPGVKVVRRKTDQGIVEETVLSDELKQERQQREQMIDDLMNQLDTTPEERRESFDEAKQAYLQNFEETIEPEFEQRRQDLEAQQARTGRQLSSVGRAERQEQRESQQQIIAQEQRRAEQMRRQLAQAEDQRTRYLVQQLEAGMDADLARQQQAMQGARQSQRQAFSQQLGRFQAQNRINQQQRNRRLVAAQTGARLGTYGYNRYYGQGGGTQTGIRIAGQPASNQLV